MQLVRLAVLEMEPAPDHWDIWQVAIGEVELSTVRVLDRLAEQSNHQRLLIKAVIKLPKYPDLDTENRMMIPHKERRLCENGIEDVANLISLLGKCSRNIYSPASCVAIVPENRSEMEFLSRSKGILVQSYNFISHHYQIDSSLSVLFSLSDRMAGVALLSEAFSSSDVALKFRNFTRLFEIAFSTAMPELAKKLYKFLLPGRYGYELKEINQWMQMRSVVSYADQRKEQGITLDSNFRYNLSRLEQAALDVIFNKFSWRDSSTNRRELWEPPVISATPDKPFAVGENFDDMKVKIQFFDDFGIFPKDVNVNYDGQNEGWYMKTAYSV